MKKNNFTLGIFLVIGLLAGTIIGSMVSAIGGLSILTETADISWNPKGDFEIIKYDINIAVELNLFSLIGLIVAFWAHRKL